MPDAFYRACKPKQVAVFVISRAPATEKSALSAFMKKGGFLAALEMTGKGPVCHFDRREKSVPPVLVKEDERTSRCARNDRIEKVF